MKERVLTNGDSSRTTPYPQSQTISQSQHLVILEHKCQPSLSPPQEEEGEEEVERDVRMEMVKDKKNNRDHCKSKTIHSKGLIRALLPFIEIAKCTSVNIPELRGRGLVK